MSTASFFERNRFAIIAGVATVAVIGGSLYYSSRAQEPSDKPDSNDAEGGDSKNSASISKKRRMKKKQAASRKAAPQQLHGFNLVQEGNSTAYPEITDWAQVEALGETERKELGDQFKQAGNYAFNNKQYESALDLYTQAIRCHDKEPVYYSNRAAVYGALGQYEKVVEDATTALDMCPDYAKCFSRRGGAYEKLKRYSDAATDYTAACILSNFEDANLGKSVDRLLRLRAEEVVAEKFGAEGTEIKSSFPSHSFIQSYLTSFRHIEKPAELENCAEGSGDHDLSLALDAIDRADYESYKEAFKLSESAIAKGMSNESLSALAYELRGTFHFLCGDCTKALADINKSLELSPTTTAYIKRSCVHVELGAVEEALKDFKNAEQLDPTRPEIFFQIAQLSFLQQDWNTAAMQYEKAISLDDSFLVAHIQLAVTKYRLGSVEVARRRFQKLVDSHPESALARNYFGEVLLDMKEFQAAGEQFDKAIEIEERRGKAINVLPLINRSFLLLQSAPGPVSAAKATELCQRAVDLDPLSDVAVGTLAQLYLQQSKTNEAVKLFERNAQLARTYPERIQAITFAEAARTQLRISTELPLLREKLEQLSRQQ